MNFQFLYPVFLKRAAKIRTFFNLPKLFYKIIAFEEDFDVYFTILLVFKKNYYLCQILFSFIIKVSRVLN